MSNLVLDKQCTNIVFIDITYILVIICLMYRELVEISNKMCIDAENYTFNAWLSPNRYKPPPEQRAYYTP